MCGRYALNDSPQMLMLFFGLDSLPAPYVNADVRPGGAAPVIRMVDGKRLAVPAYWGLIPSWAKDEGIARHTFNARAEGVAEKPSFRAAFKRRRCLVPVSAFYEWQAVPGQKKKRKLRFFSPDRNPLALAGLWEHWNPQEDAPAVETYTVITTTANQLLAPIHDRMPVVLGKSDWDAWLDPDLEHPVMLQAMLQPCPESWLEYAEG